MSKSVSKAFFDNNIDVLKMVDSTFVVERTWFQHMHNKGCADRILKKVDGIFSVPKGQIYLDPAIVSDRLENFKQQAFYTFGSQESKIIVNVCQEWAKAVQSNRSPSFKAVGGNQALMQIQQKMEVMLKYNVTVQLVVSGPAICVKVGKEALELLYHEVKARKTAGEKVNLGHLKDFDTFSWMMNAEQAAFHKTMVSECFKAGDHAAPARQRAPLPKKAKVESASSSTASLFKKRG